MEKELPYNWFDKKWECLKKGDGEKYTRVTKIEMYVPIYFPIPYICIISY